MAILQNRIPKLRKLPISGLHIVNSLAQKGNIEIRYEPCHAPLKATRNSREVDTAGS